MCCGAVKATPLVEEESEKNQGFKDYIFTYIQPIRELPEGRL